MSNVLFQLMSQGHRSSACTRGLHNNAAVQPAPRPHGWPKGPSRWFNTLLRDRELAGISPARHAHAQRLRSYCGMCNAFPEGLHTKSGAADLTTLVVTVELVLPAVLFLTPQDAQALRTRVAPNSCNTPNLSVRAGAPYDCLLPSCKA